MKLLFWAAKLVMVYLILAVGWLYVDMWHRLFWINGPSLCDALLLVPLFPLLVVGTFGIVRL